MIPATPNTRSVATFSTWVISTRGVLFRSGPQIFCNLHSISTASIKLGTDKTLGRDYSWSL